LSIRTKRNSRRFIAAAAAVAVAASTFATTSGPAGAAPTVTVARVAGDDRFETSIEISKATFPVSGTTTHVILASGTSEVDGLAAAALAGRHNGPVLLIPSTGAVSAALNAEITRLGATNIIIVGGNAAIAAAAETNLAAAGRTITRLSGADRYETAAAVATAVGAANVGNFPGTTRKAVIIARGDNAADALTASGVAFAGKHPILLTRTGSLDANASAAITALGATQAVIMGGTAAISDATKDAIEALGVTTVRVAGADRAATATAFANTAVTAFGFTRAVPMLVSGTVFADALSAGPHSGKESVPCCTPLLPARLVCPRQPPPT
jgi:putative cell wall-binding protein